MLELVRHNDMSWSMQDDEVLSGWNSDISWYTRRLVVKSYPNLDRKLIVAELVNGRLEVYTFAKYLSASQSPSPCDGLLNQLYGMLIKELLESDIIGKPITDRSYILVINDETVIDCSKYKPLNVRWLGKGDPRPGLVPLCYDAKDPRWSAKVVIRNVVTDAGACQLARVSAGYHAKVCVVLDKSMGVGKIIECIRLAESCTDAAITVLYLNIVKPPIDQLVPVLAHLTDIRYIVYQSGAIRCRSVRSELADLPPGLGNPCLSKDIQLNSINELMDLPI